MFTKLRSLFSALFKRGGFEKEMDQEMRFHLDSYSDDLVKGGTSRAEAERRARIEFGGVELAQEHCRQSRGVRGIDQLRQDTGYAFRTIKKNPGFALVAIVTVGLGVGVNSAVFSVLNTVILKPLPFNQPERIVSIGEVNATHGSEVPLFSPANYVDLGKQQKSFESITTLMYGSVKYSNNGTIENWPIFQVPAEFFTTLGVAPLAGRTFSAADIDANPANTIIISYRLWKKSLGGDPQIIGKTLILAKQPFTVIGIMPETFRAPSSTDYADLWVPLSTKIPMFQNRSDRFMSVIGRLKNNVTLSQAQNELNVIAARFAQDHPESNKGWSMKVTDIGERITGDIRKPLFILFVAGCFVLLVACANVANLLLARATARRRELGIRSALGAGRGRLMRQVLTESTILTLIGGALGATLTWWTIRAVREFKPGDLPRVDELAIDWRVLFFTVAASILAGCACGAISGWISTNSEMITALKDGGSQSSGGRRHTYVRNILVVTEISLSLVLLISAGLLTRSFYKLTSENPGFDSRSIFAARIAPSSTTDKQRADFYQRLIERVRQIPGIESAALATAPPLTSNTISFPISVKGESLGDSEKIRTALDSISTDYFKTIRIPIKAGRDITEQDKFGDHRVAVVNEALVRRYFGANEKALGRELEIVYLGSPITAEIVGVVGDTKRDSLAEVMQPSIFLPENQVPWLGATIVARTKSDPIEYRKPIEQALHELDIDQDLFAPRSMEEAINSSVAQPKFYSMLFGGFAIITVVLACVGLYGVISYLTSQRTQEIGIRMALGAQKSSILTMILSQGMILVGIGVALGLAGAFVATRFLSTLLYDVSATDVFSYLSVSLMLITVALFACYIPARRATKADPLTALRYN